MRKMIWLFLLIPLIASAADPKVGFGRLKITPQESIWMAGYANRNHPSEGVLQDLWAKALAIDDGGGHRVVIVTTDLIGLPRSVSDVVAARIAKEHGIDRAGLVLNSSHTHTGPVVYPNLRVMYDLDAANQAAAERYSQQLQDALVNVVGAALGDLAPARIEYGVGNTGFAANRREFTANGVRIGVNPKGPVDHSVPVLKITKPDGTLRGVLFGYACHNTTLTGEFYKLSGDYSGFAQVELESRHPGATAMFMMLCGADANPNPRSTLTYAEQHGKTLAAEVDRVLGTKMETIKPKPVRTAFSTTQLALQPHTRSTFEALQNDKNIYKARLAKTMLKAYDDRHPIQTVTYPIQAVRLGKDLMLLALGGEVVVDYALRAKREFPKTRLIVAGYTNDVMCYIPTAQILKEGGYEAVDSMVYYGQPAPFTPEVEETIFENIRKVMKRAGY